ncbi:5,10-methenyltetrahydrofolate synthetase [Belliella baltica DSM 15883]|uniref:5-formyltetrahydrofolate cyclo-ligase n=1 Tax=Belliella baltica (strain DSM 15883 / CIP 108006 / LMG 21964 / BA134) TaxID=866536 RepID=I3Z3Z1_BELBD|nr:5-formyltetrahydrofolate cyclo-ligase [Belliella baltica]AFL83959.1 5,10-methenyltetrahydrofolate synthetase [Belliella baltica DSM 15883]
MTKEEIRILFKEKRKQLKEEEIESLSTQIRQRVRDFLNDRKQLCHIHLFLPILKLKEVNIFPLIDELLLGGYELYTSILDTKSGVLETVCLTDIQDLDHDSWGIPIPRQKQVVSTDPIQLVLIPLLACDKNGNRIGYGKGYYDGFLSTLQSDVLKVGLNFFNPIDQIESEWHDILLDVCITPSEVFLF